MARSFNHYLYIVRPRTLCKLAESYKLLYLAHVRCISQTARAASVTQRYCHVVLLAYVENLIKIFIKRIFIACHAHPCKHKASAAAYYVHFALVISYLIYRFSCYSAVQSYKINSVLGMKAYNIYKILCRKLCQIALIVNYAVVYGNSSYHCGAFRGQFSSERLSVAVA